MFLPHPKRKSRIGSKRKQVQKYLTTDPFYYKKKLIKTTNIEKRNQQVPRLTHANYSFCKRCKAKI